MSNHELHGQIRDELTAVVDKLHELLPEYGLELDTFGRVTTPGKFEAEHFSIVYWYDQYLNGDGEHHSCEADPGFSVFTMSWGERILFEGIINKASPSYFGYLEARDSRFAVLSFSDVGFCCIEYMDEGELHDAIDAWEARFGEGD